MVLLLKSLSEDLQCWLALAGPSVLLFRLIRLRGLLCNLFIRYAVILLAANSMKYGIVHNFTVQEINRARTIWWPGSLMRFSCEAGPFICWKVWSVTMCLQADRVLCTPHYKVSEFSVRTSLPWNIWQCLFFFFFF